MSLSLEDLLQHYPFLSFIKYTHSDYVGVIQNHDGDIVSIYAFNKLRTEDHKRRFLEQADQWWWESNRLVPINVFLKQDWVEFRIVLKTFNSKDVAIQHGPYVSLKEIANKRSKRRSITLVRKVN